MSSTFNKYRTKGAYHWDWYETEDWYKQCVDECVKFCKGATVDVGCGDGLLLSKLPAGSCGLDNDPDALLLCKQKGMVAFNVDLDKQDPGFWKPYQYMACLNTIEHLYNPERLKIIIDKYTSKGAIIMTLEWQGGAFGEDHKKEYTLPELIEFFDEFNPESFRLDRYPEWIGVKIRK